MPTATVGDLTLNYELRGDAGTPVLMIMGLSVRGDGWRFQVPDLAKHHRVAFYDNRGVGDSDVPDPPYSIAAMAQDAVGLMDHLGWARAHIVGVSMGGMIAQLVGLDHPKRVKSLSLIATSPGGFTNRLPTARGLSLFVRLFVSKSERRVQLMKTLLFPKSYRQTVDHDFLDDVLRRDFGEAPQKEGRRGQLRAVFKHDARKRLPALEGIPTLIVKPEADSLVRPHNSERLHKLIPGSTVLRIPDAGHGLIRQVPDILNPALLAHFAAADAKPPANAPVAASA